MITARFRSITAGRGHHTSDEYATGIDNLRIGSLARRDWALHRRAAGGLAPKRRACDSLLGRPRSRPERCRRAAWRWAAARASHAGADPDCLGGAAARPGAGTRPDWGNTAAADRVAAGGDDPRRNPIYLPADQ